MAGRYWTAEDLKAAGFASGESEVFEITGAEQGRSVGVRSRAQVYALKMVLRLVCIIAGVWLGGVWMWVFLVGALVLPWSAVMVANGEARRSSGEFTALLPPEQQMAIEQAWAQRDRNSQAASQKQEEPVAAGSAQDFEAGVVIDGELVLDDEAAAGSEKV